MQLDWSPLTAELRHWQNGTLPLPIWWRDDDATAPSAPLDQLLTLSQQIGLPVHVAVIPAGAQPTLVPALRDGGAVPLVHGYAHENHAPPEQKKAEFGQPRSGAEAEIGAGLARLSGLFGADLLPLFVPPWNRLAPELRDALPRLGFAGVSTFTPRQARETAPGLIEINTHIDPIFWRGGGGLVPADRLIAALVQNLTDRRAGRSDAREPLGFLTHHLVHDAQIWTFTRDCLSRLLDAGALPQNLREQQGDLP